MNKFEELKHLKELHESLKNFESIECKEIDVKVVELAIKRVEKEIKEETEEDLFAILKGEKTVNEIRGKYGVQNHSEKIEYICVNIFPINKKEGIENE